MYVIVLQCIQYLLIAIKIHGIGGKSCRLFEVSSVCLMVCSVCLILFCLFDSLFCLFDTLFFSLKFVLLV